MEIDENCFNAAGSLTDRFYTVLHQGTSAISSLCFFVPELFLEDIGLHCKFLLYIIRNAKRLTVHHGYSTNDEQTLNAWCVYAGKTPSVVRGTDLMTHIEADNGITDKH